MLRAPPRTARAVLIMLVVQGATLAVMLVALLACALVSGLVIESAAGVLPWLPGGTAIVGALVTVVSLTAFWWALRAWCASATFTRLRTWTWRYLDEPFHDTRRPEGQEWVFAPHDDFPRYFATEAEARQCATGWVATRDQLPAPGAHGRKEGTVPVYWDENRPAGRQWVCAEPGALPVEFATRAEAEARSADRRKG